MSKRILTAAVALVLFLPVLYFSDTVIFPIVFGLLAGIAFYEFALCAGNGKKIFVSVPVILLSAVMPIAARYCRRWLIVIVCSVFLYFLFLSVIDYGKIQITEINALFFGFVYTAVPFTLFVIIRDMVPQRYLLILIAAWCTDTFAYFGGRFFGKKKLCPNLSPKKTVAGAISGVLGAVVGFAVFGLVIELTGGSFPFLKYCIIAVTASIVSQLGDLSASVIKRHYGIKDYGYIFPGHGGVLDRFDSILPLTMGTYIILSLI